MNDENGDVCPKCGENQWNINYTANMHGDAVVELNGDQFTIVRILSFEEMSTDDEEIQCRNCMWTPDESWI